MRLLHNDIFLADYKTTFKYPTSEILNDLAVLFLLSWLMILNPSPRETLMTCMLTFFVGKTRIFFSLPRPIIWETNRGKCHDTVGYAYLAFIVVSFRLEKIF